MDTHTDTSAAPAGASVGVINYLLHLADNAVVLGQRNAEWCGHGPILEEDLALANMSLDLIGQARLLYQLAAERMGDFNGEPATEDRLAYFRDVPDFRNYTLLELPHHSALVGYAKTDLDYATTIVRNFLFSALMVPLWHQLQQPAHNPDAALGAIAAKSFKEASYHLRHARDWLVKLGDGTADSHARTQAALDHLLPYTLEFWTQTALETDAAQAGIAIDWTLLAEGWHTLVNDALSEATLSKPDISRAYVHRGKLCQHSEHLGYVLAEMQSLARAHPGAPW
jgi:ring-1,2-phenylacetyl-CoA epoxidase subunit PaaC